MIKKFILVDGKKLFVETDAAFYEIDSKKHAVYSEPDPPTDPPSPPPVDPLIPPAPPAPSPGDDDDKLDKELKSFTDGLTEKIAKIVSDAKISREVKDKETKLFGKTADPNGMKMKLYTTKKGKVIEVDKEQGGDMGKWFQSLLKKDGAGMKEYFTKWEPLNEATAAEGGNLVPVALYSVLIEIMEDIAVIKPRATVIDMTGMKTNQLNLDSILTKPIVQWGSEQAAKATSSMTFQQISLTPYKLAAIVPITNELIQDSPFNVIQIVAKALGEAVAKEEDKVFTTGSGTGRPTGLTAYTMGYVISAGNALAFNHLISAFWGLPSYYRNRASWVMNGRTIANISSMADTTGRPLLLDSGIITEPGIPALKGRPVLEQNDMPSATIYFGDLSAYFIGMKLPMTIDVADQATVAGYNLWERNMVAVRVEERVDGELTMTRAFAAITNTGVA